jgi:hypothetical protein
VIPPEERPRHAGIVLWSSLPEPRRRDVRESMRGMLSHEKAMRLPLKEAPCLTACRLAVEELGWLLHEQGRAHLRCSRSGRLSAFHRPVRILICVDPVDKTVTRVRLYGDATGIGPLANRAIQREVDILAARIEAVAQRFVVG